MSHFRCYLLTLGLLMANCAANAQSASPTVVATTGGTGTAGNMTLDWTLGEPMVTTLDNGQLVLTQGFHQPGGAFPSALPAPFITTWNTANTGTSGSTEITIPTTGAGYLYHLDWNNDGVYDQFNVTGSVSHDFGVPGTYTIRITGAFPRIFFNGAGDRLKLLSVDQWGATPWTSMAGAFKGCSNMNLTATDAPDLSLVTDLSECFMDCIALTADLDQWDVLGITTMTRLFRGCTLFNGDVTTWATDSVTDMSGMFTLAGTFNRDISGWNTSKVTTMAAMFSNADSFDQPIGVWDVGQVQFFNTMFTQNDAFDQPLNDWDVHSAVNFFAMFSQATAFNQPLDQWTFGAVSLSTMFSAATAFDQDLGAWDISQVTNFPNVLNNCGMSTANYDATLIGWSTLDAGETQIPVNKTLGATGLHYCLGEAARNTLIATYGWTINDAGLSPTCGGVSVALRVFLQGPYNSGTGLMDDGLRANGLVPLSEPYTALGYSFVGGGGESTTQPILDFPGSNAIIDWVVLELRDKNDNTNVLQSRAALLQADGDVVDVDGFSSVSFGVPSDSYFISIIHRNHLGVMTLAPVALTSTAASVDFTDGSTATYGAEAQQVIAGTYLLWAGDVTFDGDLKYVGQDNDRDPILVAIGGTVPTTVLTGEYRAEDVNLDGEVKYVGTDNDRDPILQNIGGSVPTAVRNAQLP
ncbi:MAG: DUF285 domain-containing protein [Flavobacteriales bacterium]|nr:DUF285 domain-containing protein [Flavobacteriales bacterium]